jgi:hypothetical protein
MKKRHINVVVLELFNILGEQATKTPLVGATIITSH